ASAGVSRRGGSGKPAARSTSSRASTNKSVTPARTRSGTSSPSGRLSAGKITAFTPARCAPTSSLRSPPRPVTPPPTPPTPRPPRAGGGGPPTPPPAAPPRRRAALGPRPRRDMQVQITLGERSLVDAERRRPRPHHRARDMRRLGHPFAEPAGEPQLAPPL